MQKKDSMKCCVWGGTLTKKLRTLLNLSVICKAFHPVVRHSLEGKDSEKETKDKRSNCKMIYFNLSVAFWANTCTKEKILGFVTRPEKLTLGVFIERTAPSGSLWGRSLYFHSFLRPTSRSSGTPGNKTRYFCVFLFVKHKEGKHIYLSIFMSPWHSI